MIWRTCGSDRRSSARSAYSTRAVGLVAPGGDEPQVLRGVGVVAQLAQPAGQLGRGPERRHPVTADQPGDRRVIDARLLGQLPLRHLLGLELGSKPFVERSAVLSGHAAWALLGACRVRSMPLVRCLDAAMMRRAGSTPVSPVGTGRRRARRACGNGRERWGRSSVRWGRSDARRRGTKVRLPVQARLAGRVNGGANDVADRRRGARAAACRPDAAVTPASTQPMCRRDVDPPEAARLRREHVGDRAEDDDREDADDAIEQGDGGRLGQRHAVGDVQHADDARLDDPEPGRAERHGREQRADERDEDRARDAERDVVEAERLDRRGTGAVPRSSRSARSAGRASADGARRAPRRRPPRSGRTARGPGAAAAARR